MAQRSRRPAPRSRPKKSGKSRRPRPDEGGRRSVLWRMRRGLFLVGLLVMSSVAGLGFLIAQVEIPEEDILLQSTFVCAGDVTEDCGPDNAIATLAGEQDRVSVPISQIPQVFIDAVLAAEDRNFFRHQGIDPMGIARALYRDLRDDSASRQGGSTITQQYAKLAFLTPERTISRKIKEAILAIQLEREFSKEEILERYLNRAYFGRGAYGVEAASRAYFDRSIRDVNLSQAAYLAGLLRSPETADAIRDPETATFRRNSVLNGMEEMGTITSDERDAAKAVDLYGQVIDRSTRDGLGRVKGAAYGTEFFVDYVRRLLYDEYGSEIVNTGGLRVYTTLNMDYQQAAYNAIYGTLNQDTDPEGALVTVDEAGGVVAMVGGERFGEDEGESEVNLALGTRGGGTGRQPGSAFKPFVLTAAIEQGISVRSKFQNVNEREFPGADNGADYEMSNYSDVADERVMDLVEATHISSNTIYGELIQEVGYQTTVDMAHRLGIDAELPPVLALALGVGEVSVLDMADAYSTLARRGQHIEPFFITKVEQVTDEGTQVLFTREAAGEQVIDPTVADQVTAVLRGVMNTSMGTGRGADFGIPAAGKTGTTQDYRDAWFVGYTPKLTTAVWMGYPDPDENGNPIYMRDVRGREITGGSMPAEMWRRYMVAITGAESQGNFAEAAYGGNVLNPDLQPTTTTLPLCGSPEAAEEDAEAREEAAKDGEELPPDYTAPCRTTTTTTESTTTTTTAPEETSPEDPPADDDTTTEPPPED